MAVILTLAAGSCGTDVEEGHRRQTAVGKREVTAGGTVYSATITLGCKNCTGEG